MKTLTVTIHFLEPFRVIEWHKWDDRNSKRFMRGYSFARWHNSDDSDHPCNSGRPYITGTLVRSAFLKSVEQFLWMHNGMGCCPGEFKDSNAKIFHHPNEPEKLETKRLRRRQTLKWDSSKELCDINSADPCPLCLLLGRCDKAEAGNPKEYKPEDYDVKFSNFNIGIEKEMRLEDMAQSRIINRVDQEDGKAEDFVKIWEIDPDICGSFTGKIHLSDKADKTEVRELIEKAAVLTDRIAGSLCSVTISGETEKNACAEIPSAQDRNDYFKELAEKIEKGFQDGNKTVHLRLFADVIREMRCKDQSVLQNLPKGHKERGAKSADTYKAHFIWDEVKIEGKKLRNRLPEMFQNSGMEWTVFCQKLGQALYVSAKKSGPEQFPAPRPVGSAEGVHISDDPQTELEKSAGENTLHEILICGQLTAKTPFFFGWSSGEGEEKSGEEQTSMRVLTTKDGSFRLPRSVLRGILRRDLKTVFGTGCRAELGHRSPCVCPVCRVMRQITIKDSPSAFKNPPRIRHRIRLDHASGTVAQGALFDMEVGPRGVRFPFELRLRSPEEKIPKELRTVLQWWSNGMAFLSGAAGTGKGRFQLDNARWQAWNLKNDFEDYKKHLGGRNRDIKLKPENKLPPATADKFPFKSKEVKFFVSTPFITRDPIGSLMLKPFEKECNEEATDAICYQSEYVDKKGEKQEEYLLKGESFRGILRTIIGRKENLLTQKHDDCSCLLCRLFGNEHKAGKIRVEDLRILQDTGTKHIDRVAIDRFTGGAKDKHKFDMLPRLASPEHPLFFEGKIWISRDLVQKDKDALNRALQDIQNGFYPFGGLGNIGLGWVNYLLAGQAYGEPCPELRLAKDIPDIPRVEDKKDKIYWPHYFLPFGPKVKRENTPPSHAFMDKKLHSGKLQCSLKTLTPLIIPDSENVREDAEKPEHKIYDFFNLNGTHCIPGSEIRGMVSSVYEALSNSCLRIFDEKKRLSWRMEADHETVLKHYLPGKVSDDGKSVQLFSKTARVPFYDDSQKHFSDFTEDQIEGRMPVSMWVKKWKAFFHKPEDTSGNWKSKEGYLLVTGPCKVEFSKKVEELIKTFVRKKGMLPSVPEDWKEVKTNFYKDLKKKTEPVLCCKDKDDPNYYTMAKYCETFFYDLQDTSYEITDDVIAKYKELLDCYNNNPQSVSNKSFQSYVVRSKVKNLEPGTLVYFKHNGAQVTDIIPVRISRKVDDMLLAQRLPDDRRPCVREILNENHAEKIKTEGIKEIFQHHPEGLCPGCALFGTGFYKSRVSFGFAFPLSENPSFLNGGNPVTLPLLERPRPTWSIPGKADNAEKKTPVPGRKFYVHHQGWKDVLKKSEEKEESRREKKNENNRSVQVMDKEQEFQFEIRFENLRDWELGLLIYSLQLEKGLAHKLGMGRPLGFGSVEIQVTGIAGDSEISMDEIHEKTSRKLSNLWKAEPEETEAEKNPEKLFALLRYVENENIRVRYPALKKEDSEEKDKPGYMELKEGAFKEEDRQEKLKKPWSYWYKKSKS